MRSRIPVALIGAGRVAHAAYRPLLLGADEPLRLVAVVETDPVRAAAVADDWAGVPVEADIQSAVKRGARAVVCATPWFTHRAVVDECLQHGLHVLCEKPVSVDPAEISQLRERESATGLPVAVGYMKRHSDVVADLVERAAADLGAARELTVDVVDPNAPHQIAHLVPAAVLHRPPPSPVALDIAARMLPGAPEAHREALLHGLGGSLVHHVNIVHAVLERSGLELAGNLVYATQWADGSAVACGWRPRSDLVVRLSHVRVPRHRRYSEEIRLVTESSALSVSLPSPYAREETGVLTSTTWDGSGREQTVVHRGRVAGSPFVAQLAAWSAMIEGRGPALPGLAEAYRDATVIHEVARSLS